MALMFERQAGGMTVGVNPNLELMYAILQLAGSSAQLRRYEHTPDARSIFAAYKGHPAVAELDAGGALNWGKGFDYGDFARYPLHFSEMPDGRRVFPYDDFFLSRVLGDISNERKTEYLDAYWEKARDFCLKSGFLDYLEKNAPVYISCVESVCANIPAFDVITAHEDYHSKPGFKFHIVPIPLGLPSGGSYGLNLGGGIFNLMGSGYGSADRVKSLMLHEFGHTFCNTVVEKHLALVEKYADLYRGMKDKMTPLAYDSWEKVMLETLVRAVHARLLLKAEGAGAAARILESDKEKGFAFIRDFFDLLGEYERDRGNYPTLFEFYPRLAAALNNWEVRETEEPEPFGIRVADSAAGPTISLVRAGGPAHTSGLREKDTVISVDGEKPLPGFPKYLEGGKTYSVTVMRDDGKAETIPLKRKLNKCLRLFRKA